MLVLESLRTTLASLVRVPILRNTNTNTNNNTNTNTNTNTNANTNTNTDTNTNTTDSCDTCYQVSRTGARRAPPMLFSLSIPEQRHFYATSRGNSYLPLLQL